MRIRQSKTLLISLALAPFFFYGKADAQTAVADTLDVSRIYGFRSPLNNQSKPGAIRIYDPDTESGRNYVSFRTSYTLSANAVYVLPRVAPSASGLALITTSVFDSLTWGAPSLNLTVREVDASPSVSSVTVLEFENSNGFVVTNPSGTTARIDLSSLVTRLGQTIETAEITDSTITNADVSASAAISPSKLAAGLPAQVPVASSLGVITYRTLSGDATISDTGVLTVADDSHSHSNYALNTVTLTAGDGLAGGGDLSANRAFAVNLDFDGALESVDDSLNIKLDGGTLARAAAGLKVADGGITTTQVSDGTLTEDDINSNLAGSALVLTPGSPGTLDWAPSELGNITFGNSGAATVAWTLSLSGATDPVLNFGNNLLNVTNAQLQEGGADVFTTADGALNEDNLGNNNIDDLADVTITSAVAGNIIIRNSGNTAFVNVAMSGDATISAGGSVTVGDDSHAHTGITLSGIDISDDTNLSAVSPVTLTGDQIAFNQAANFDWSARHRFRDGDSDTLTVNPAGFGASNTFAAGTRALQLKDGASELFYVDTTGALNAITLQESGNAITSNAEALGGDLSGTLPNPSVTDDSHAHTTSTISGLDAGADFSAGVLAIARGGTSTGTAPSDGKLLIGKTDGTYAVANLAAGSNISVTNGDGTVTIAATGVGEVNTASNLGTGLPVYNSKSGVTLRFNSFSTADFDSASNTLSIKDSKWAKDSELHNAVTLASDADVLLGLSTQQLTLDAQSANIVFAGPASGGATDPTFRALVDDDIPNNITITNLSGANTGDVTLAGTPDYITISGQVITRNDVDLGTETAGNYVASVATTSPLAGGASGSEGAALTLSITANGINATHIDETVAYNFSSTSNQVRAVLLHADSLKFVNNGGIKAVDDTLYYFKSDGSLQFRLALADAPSVGEILKISAAKVATWEADAGEVNTASNLGGGLANYDSKSGVDLRFNSFASADFDLASNLLTIDDTKWAKDSELHAAVTLAGENYLSLSAQQITANAINLASSNVTGTLPDANVSNDLTLATVSGAIDAGGATSFEVPNGATPTVDAFGKIAGDNNLWAVGRGSLVTYDGTAATALVGVLVSDAPSSGEIPKFNSDGTITWEADNTGGTPSWSGLAAPTSATSFVSDGTSETFSIDFQAAFTTGSQFVLKQSTGNPTGGILADIQTADADVTPFRLTAQGTSNGVQMNASGVLAPIGTGQINANRFNGSSGALTDDDLSNNSIDDLNDVTITSAAAAHLIVRNSGNTAWVNVAMSGDGAIDATGALTVNNDSHAHTGSTISGLDVSDDLNLVAGTNITLTGDQLDVDDAFVLNTGDVIAGNLDFSDGSGDSPKALFTPQTGTVWALYTEDTGDDLQIEVNTASTETLDIVNVGAGTINVTVDGTLTASNISGTNTGDEALSTSSAGLDVSDHVIDLDVTPSSGSATLEQSEDALQVKYDSEAFAEGASGLALAAGGVDGGSGGDIADASITADDVANATLTNAKLANMAQNTIKLRVASGSGAPEDVDISTGLSLVTAASGDFVIIEDATDGGLKRVDVGDFLGGGVAWDAISDPSTSADVAFGVTAQTLSGNTDNTTAAAQDLFALNYTNDGVTDVTPQRVFVINKLAASTNAVERGLVIDNQDDNALDVALEIVGTSTGAVTTAIKIDDAEIGTALALGLNDVTVGGATLSSTELAALDDGIALTSETSGNYVATVATSSPLAGGAAGSEGTAISLSLNANGITAAYLDETDNFDFTGTVLFDSDALRIDDTNASHQLIITPGSDLTANRILTITTGDAARTLTFAGDATISNTNSGDVTIAGENYLSLANQVLTANAVNLSGTHVTGTLAAARFPALTGHVTTTAGNLATTIANSVVTAAMMANGDHGAFTYASNVAALDAGSVSGGNGGVITDNSITSDDIGADAVGASELAADALLWNEVGDAGANGSVSFGDTEQIIVSSQISGDVAAFTLDINQVDDAAATDDLIAFTIDATSESGDAGDTFTLMRLLYENGTANTVLDRALLIDNAETTANTMTDAILITSSGVNDGIVDAIDVSAANITNAINIGANNIITSGATISSAELDRLDGLANAIVTDATAVTDVDGAGLAISGGVLAVGAGTAITVNANDVAVTADGIGPTQLDETANYALSGANTVTGSMQFDGDALRILDAGADHYMTITPGTNYTANRVLTITTGDAARTITLSGNLNIAADFTTSGANALTLTTSGATNVTLPTTGTVATLAGTETFTSKSLTSPALTGTPTIANGATSSGNFQIFEDSDNGSNKITVQAPASLAADATWQIGPKHLVVAFSDESTALTTGTAKITFRFPCKATIVDLRASLKTASSSGTPTFDINESGTTIISTKLTIDANETTSTTAATAYVLSDTSIADDAEITIDIDTAGTGAVGGKIIFYYYPAP